LRIADCHLSIAKDVGNGQSAIHLLICCFSEHPPRLRPSGFGGQAWNTPIKSPAMTTQNAQNRAVRGSSVAITCHKLPSISIESLHFHYTRAGRGPPSQRSESNCSTRRRSLVNLILRESCAILLHQRSQYLTPAIHIRNEQVAEFCARHRIRRLALFGSVLRSDFRPDSDVDVLVEFEPGAAVGFFGMARLERELSALLGGRRVDLRTPEDLSRYFRKSVVDQSYLIHGAG
jgi:uncharacterized protein